MRAEGHWQVTMLLFQQKRWDLAIRELRALLTQQPGNAHAHALLAIALAEKGDLPAARTEAEQAIACDPELDLAHRALAVVLFHQEKPDAAAEAIQRAIQFAPDDADHRGMLAQIRCGQRRWQEALQAADEGLALDPHDVDCLNLRSLALTKLGRSAEATDSVDEALAKDPDNPYTHQARGWALLHRGDAKGALHHFQEALRRDPTLDGSRAGLVEALKARNPIYRLVLGWFLWLDRFSTGKQWQILIGAWLVARFGSQALEDVGYETSATVVRYSWLALVLFTACAVPVFNLLLLLHPIGRHALDKHSRLHAMLLGGCLAITVGVVVYMLNSIALWASRGWIFWLLYLLPIAGLGLFHSGWARRVMQTFCVAVLVTWVWWAVRIEVLQREGLEMLQRGADTVSRSRAEEFLATTHAHLDLHSYFVAACALSTWFVLLAPKGRPPRRAHT